MLGIKTKIIAKLMSRFSAEGLSGETPPIWERLLLKRLIQQQLRQDLRAHHKQNPVLMQVDYFAQQAIKLAANYMPNNLGNWSIKQPHSFTTRLERELIRFIKQKYQAPAGIAGHCGSGSTEGNLYAAWLGRNYLQHQNQHHRLVMVKSSLAHYSLNKAADLTGVDLVEASIDPQQLCLDATELVKLLERLYQQGKRGFLLPLTLGYTVSGTADDYQKIAKLAKHFERTHKDAQIFIWLDAAFTGARYLFDAKSSFRPFQPHNIQLISADFHKFLGIPYPANFLLYRRSLLSLISKPIPYIDQQDTTLLGSRPGNSVLTTFYTLLCNSPQQVMHKFQRALRARQQFLEQIRQEKLNLQIVAPDNSLQACLVPKDRRSQQVLKNKYSLQTISYPVMISNKRQALNVCKLYFLLEDNR